MRGWPLVALLVAAAAGGLAVEASRGLLDLEVYRYGGRAVIDGIPLYDGRDPLTDLPFTYPPFAALAMVPLAVLPGEVAAVGWTMLSVGALAGVVALAAGARASVTVALVAVCVLLEPVWQTVAFGQVNLLLMLAIVADLLRPDRRWAGVLVGVAAGIKLTPLVFVVLLLLVGRRSAAGRALLTFAATIAVGFLVLPATAWTYWTEALLDPGRVGGTAYAGNQSVYGGLSRLLGAEPPTLVWLLVAGPVALAVVVVAARVWRDGDRVLGTGLAGMAMLLASPISWSHHWVWAVVVGLAVLRRSRRWALAWAAVFVAAPVWWFPHGDDREHGWGVPGHLVGNAYLLAALVVAGWAARSVWTGSGRGGRHAVAGVDREHALDRA